VIPGEQSENKKNGGIRRCHPTKKLFTGLTASAERSFLLDNLIQLNSYPPFVLRIMVDTVDEYLTMFFGRIKCVRQFVQVI